ncbi:MBL fold metallo-hydrolase [Bisgaard Taxon 10/6]|uniref:MBL fold metallo-hydrolase n=1 Tax=Exercitatus varius TaxID=67857 RepID=A0ABT6EQ39_9PAST|nr:MBL fold metallo-hydrolase [Exercitatus varius]MDG2915073.1 MBL fold metallo-hydrolase [Exercitatus varius]MDG2939134.1 MBL fold metallo-hydrolase [Exercitatus varius]MDG2945669.1 MBL fold metallo-hydrolase [Exercitatus varius]
MKLDIIPVTSFQQNCSLVWDEKDKSAAIIDPGGEAPKLIKRIEELGLNPKMILLTHGHLDHVGAAIKLKTHFNCEILGPAQADEYWFQMLPQQSRQFGLFEAEAFLPDRWLNREGEVIQLGELGFEVLHLPGHTPGHVGFIDHVHHIAFTGDVLFNQSIGRTDFPGGNHEDLMRSIKDKLFTLPDDTIVIAGHGPYTTVGQEKMHNPYVHG